MVQLKPAERVPPLEIASGGSFQFRYSLITYRYSVQVSGYRTFQPIIHLERFGRKMVFLFWKNIGRSISFPRYPWQTFLFFLFPFVASIMASVRRAHEYLRAQRTMTIGKPGRTNSFLFRFTNQFFHQS